MRSYRRDFSDFKDAVWLNAASEGPLPLVASRALLEAVRWKSNPQLLTLDKFADVPRGLKMSIGALINVHSKDVILANSASYGLHLLANGLPLKKGDEVLLMANDFPSNILPWLALQKKGIKVVQVKARDRVLTVDELNEHITKKTKVLCASHVHTFSGLILDVEGFRDLCRRHKITFVLNISQSVGTMPIDISDLGADAVVSAGYKWLCGPYGTGFFWMKPDLRAQLNLNRVYWASTLTEKQLQSEGVLEIKEQTSARKYDVFATANFFNFVPFGSAIDYFLGIGIKTVQAYQQDIIQLIVNQLDWGKYQFVSNTDRANRSALCVISYHIPKHNKHIHQLLLDNKIFTAFWKGNIRLAPHIYNSKRDIGRLCELLNNFKA